MVELQNILLEYQIICLFKEIMKIINEEVSFFYYDGGAIMKEGVFDSRIMGILTVLFSDEF